jgi:formylglycine-generating enzyme required for sulfatase activity
MPPFLDPAQDLSTRQAAVVALVQAGDEGLTHIVPLLSDDLTEMQTFVEGQLSAMGSAVVSLLLDFVEENDYQLGDQAAFRVLSNVSGRGFGEDVAQWRSWWKDVESQIASITEPSQFGEALESPERMIRYATLERIKAGPGVIDTIPKLAQMVRDEDDLWWLAIQALGAIGEEALPTLIPMIPSADNPAGVRFTAVGVLRRMGPEAIIAVPALIDELEELDRPRTSSYTDGPVFFEVVVYALNQITGERFGGDVGAWRNWWEPEEPTPEAPSSSITWTRPADGMVMIHVPEGEFQMGCDRGNPQEFCSSDEQPLHTVYLDAYYVDKYEVTNAQYVEFLNTMGNQEEDGFTWLDAESPSVHIHQNGVWQVDAGYEDHPVVEVTWYGAQAYCQWQGMRLPTEAEWEKAARGSSDTRMYPWGNEDPDCSRLNYEGDDGDCVGGTMAVGSYPSGASPYGVMDMGGSVWEWVNDWRSHDGHYYRTYPVDGWPSNPTGPDSGTDKVSRGGCWSNDWRGVRVAYRGRGYPIRSTEYLGFRCAGVAQEQ